MGDLLQAVYSTAAILDKRLGADLAQERRLVSDLKSRAELLKFELDAVVSLVEESSPTPGRVDLSPLLTLVVAQARRRYPSLTVPLDGEGGLVITADTQALAGTVTFLLLALCQAARRQVNVRSARHEARVVCTLERDGESVTSGQLAWLSEPFPNTRPTLIGLALALARRTIEPCGGSLAALPREGGGLCVQMSFPAVDA